MLFIIIRLAILGLILAAVCIYIVRSNTANKRKKILIAVVSVLILLTGSLFIPIENTVKTFSSPEASYNYNHNNRAKLVVEGEKTDFVVGSDGESDIYAIIPKSNGKWKLSVPNENKSVFSTYNEYASVDVFHYKNTSEYYISVLHTDSGPLDISDNRNSEFKFSKRHIKAIGETYYTYYAYIKDFDEYYTLIVNGKKLSMHK